MKIERVYSKVLNVYAALLSIRLVEKKTETLGEDNIYDTYKDHIVDDNIFKTYLNISSTWYYLKNHNAAAMIKRFYFLYNFAKLQALIDIPASKEKL